MYAHHLPFPVHHWSPRLLPARFGSNGFLERAALDENASSRWQNDAHSFFFTPTPDSNHNHYHHHFLHFPFLFGQNEGGQALTFESLLARALAESAQQHDELAPKAVASTASLESLPKVIFTASEDDCRALLKKRVKDIKKRLKKLGGEANAILEKGELVAAVAAAAASRAGGSGTGKTSLTLSKCFGKGRDRTCTMCFDDFEVGDEATCLPCGHWFHSRHGSNASHEDLDEQEENCPGVTKWLAAHSNSCPNCKAILPESSQPWSYPWLSSEIDCEPLNTITAACSTSSDSLKASKPNSSAPQPPAAFKKHQVVEYRNSDGAWEPATVVDVGYDSDLEPFYTVALEGEREKGTIGDRLRLPDEQAPSCSPRAREQEIAPLSGPVKRARSC